MNWAPIFEPGQLALYAQGLLTTLSILGVSLLCGGVLAVGMALGLVSRHAWLRWPLSAYTFCIRGTPLLIQVYLIYYGLAQLPWIQAQWDTVWPWTHFKEPFFCAALAFTLNTAGYTAEVFAGAIRATPKADVEAAQSLGMAPWQIMWRIVWPSAWRRALPAYGNEVIMMLQSTSLASAVPAMLDITAAASRVYADFYLPFEAYLFAALIYLCVTFCLIGVFKLAERHFLAHLTPPKH